MLKKSLESKYRNTITSEVHAHQSGIAIMRMHKKLSIFWSGFIGPCSLLIRYARNVGIVPVMQNVSIRQETNFYDENTCRINETS
jgi:hypothetical protein